MTKLEFISYLRKGKSISEVKEFFGEEETHNIIEEIYADYDSPESRLSSGISVNSSSADPNSAKPKDIEMFCDGCAINNPGPAGIGVIIKSGGKTLSEISEPIGSRSNNFAEYTALVTGLEYLAGGDLGTPSGLSVSVHSDSELMVKQVNGKFKVKSKDLLPLYMKVRKLFGMFKNIKLSHIPRKDNKEADVLSANGAAMN